MKSFLSNTSLYAVLLFCSLMLAGCSRQSAEQKQAQALALREQGDAKDDAGQPAAALDIYIQAKKLAPDDPNIYVRLANMAQKLDKPDLGLDALKNLIRLKPEAKSDQQIIAMRAAFESRLIPKTATSGRSAATIPKGGNAVGTLAHPSFDTVTTKELIIADSSGNSRMILSTDSSGGVVKLLNNQGNVALQIEVGQNGGLFTVRDNQGRPTAKVGVNPSGNGILKTMNASGKDLVILATDNTEGGLVSVSDSQGTGGTVLSTDATGGMLKILDKKGNTALRFEVADNGGWIALQNNQGRSIVQAGANSSGHGFFKTGSATGKDNFVVAPNDDGAGSISLRGKQGNEVFAVSVTDSGNGFARIVDDSGKPLVTISAVASGDQGIIEIGDGRGNTLIQIDGQKRHIWSAVYPGSSKGKTWPND